MPTAWPREPRGGSFSPLSIPGCLGYYNADDIAQGDNTAVALWPDSSGNGNDLAQGTAGARPTKRTAIVNGHDVVRFGGAHFLDGVKALGGLEKFSIFVVGSVTVPATTQAIVCRGGSGSYFPAYSIFCLGAQVRMQVGHGAETDAFAAGISASTFQIFEGRYDAALVEAWLNGGNHGQAADAASPTYNADPFRLGAMSDAAAGFKFTGDLAAVAIFAHPVSAAERQQLESYFSGRFALGL